MLTPTREAIQQKADEATFQLRALAAEKERAIKQNELATEIELATRQEELIRQQGANRLLAVQRDAEAERARTEAELARQDLTAASKARQAEVTATGEAEAQRIVAESLLGAERNRAG